MKHADGSCWRTGARLDVIADAVVSDSSKTLRSGSSGVQSVVKGKGEKACVGLGPSLQLWSGLGVVMNGRLLSWVGVGVQGRDCFRDGTGVVIEGGRADRRASTSSQT